MSCHGGTYTNHDVNGARFLPFDTPSFLYDGANLPFSLDVQSEAFRTLNQIVRNTDTEGQAGFATGNTNTFTSQTVRDLIAGWHSWYGGVDKPGCRIDDANHPFIPTGNCSSTNSPATCGWGANGLFALAYQEIPRVNCRMCHIANSDRFNWQNFNNVNTFASLICSVLNNSFMRLPRFPTTGSGTTPSTSRRSHRS
jgi:hypothetical protein